jgi:predicted RNA-binding Zn-ribbon protein involved in translation (DUF1610 family)
MTGTEFTCPVCGYEHLSELPWPSASDGSYEICPSCDVEFGYTDFAAGDPVARVRLHAAWREEWRNLGCPWRSTVTPPPADWNPEAQLRRLLDE